ncbi:CHAT domain-containing protein [Nostoc sp. CHAB 5844]|nr:CHAT domain-containing protein [Nostoc sp. CHAB 5844]
MIRLRHLFKYLLIGILGLSITISQPFLITVFATTKEIQHEQAQYLTNKGNKQLNQGQATEALDSFRKATKIYQRLNYEEGITGSLINQNLALQTLGMYPRACKTLLEALKFVAEDWICDPQISADSTHNRWLILDQPKLTPVNLLGLHSLGDVLRQLGKLSESKIVLQKTILLAKQVPDSDANTILLSLASTEQTIYEQIRNKYSEIEESNFQEKTSNLLVKQALDTWAIYQQINNDKTISILQKIPSLLNSLILLTDFDKWLNLAIASGRIDLASTQSQIQQQTQSLIKIIVQESALFSQLPINQSIYFQVNLANSLAQIPDERLHNVAVDFAQSAWKLAKSINERRMQSYCLGILANLNSQEAETYLLNALNIAQSINDLELSYKWQTQLSNLYKKKGQDKKAIQYYEASIKSITKIRSNLSSLNADLQFSFQETVEPIYRNYMRLLLNEKVPNLKQIKKINDQLQIAQLENFLKCNQLHLVSLDELKIPSSSTSINIIDLDDLVLTIVQSSNNSFNYYITKSELVQEHINNLLVFLQDEKSIFIQKELVLAESQALYDLLIAPIKQYLPLSGTLVFTLDTSFQSLPMGILHDGKDYLIKHYSIAETLGSKIRPLKSLSEQHSKALIAGLSKTSPSFSAPNVPDNLQPLPEVEKEVADISKQTKSSVKLVNEKFTSQRFQAELTKGYFPVVHVTTHGQFSSDPDRTVLLAWDKPINIREFNGWLKIQNNQNPIELLVLSACQTAKGNKRSVLGIAGVAAQAGARSIVASLWLVDSVSTTELMKEFYQGLKNGASKAEALRQAQLSLLDNPEYAHPYYWAAFILVGSWL